MGKGLGWCWNLVWVWVGMGWTAIGNEIWG